MTITRSYYAIIPANVRYDKRIRANAKLLYGEITALCNEKGFCWASNSYFSDLYGVTNKSISNWIKELANAGYVTSYIKRDENKRVEYRHIRLATPPEEKFHTPGSNVLDPREEKFHTPGEEKVKGNNTSLNTTVNTTSNKRIGEQQPALSLLKTDFDEIWKAYPNKQGKAKAFEYYKKAIKKGTTHSEILKGINNYVDFLKANKWQSPAHGSTWFNQERWNDEYELNGGGKGYDTSEYDGLF